MNLVVLSGRMYNGQVHGYTQNEEERSCFRGRLNFRLPNGDYAWIDAVCFKDNPNSDTNGLVGWLEENYMAPEDESEGHGGRAIEIVGTLRPTEKKKTVTLKLKGGGKKDVPGVPYDTFEVVIEQAYFPPLSQGERGGVDVDDEFDIDDDADLAVADDDDEEDEVTSRRNQKGKQKQTAGARSGSASGSRSANKSSGSRSSRRKAAGDDDGFFVE